MHEIVKITSSIIHFLFFFHIKGIWYNRANKDKKRNAQKESVTFQETMGYICTLKSNNTHLLVIQKGLNSSNPAV